MASKATNVCSAGDSYSYSLFFQLTSPNTWRVSHILTALPVLMLSQWTSDLKESLAASRWPRQAHGEGQSPYDVLRETGMEAACGLFEETTGTWSCFLYYDFFLSKPKLSSQFMLHERYPIHQILKNCAWSDEFGCAAEQVGQSPLAPLISPLHHSMKVG